MNKQAQLLSFLKVAHLLLEHKLMHSGAESNLCRKQIKCTTVLGQVIPQCVQAESLHDILLVYLKLFLPITNFSEMLKSANS